MQEQEQSDNKPPTTAPAGPERVGYRNPPKHTRFKKGQSGNPKGRPKRRQDVKSGLRDVYHEPIPITKSGKRRLVPAAVAIALVQRQRALAGNARAAELVFKQMKEFDFLDEVPQFSIWDYLGGKIISRLTNSALEELIAAEAEVKAEAEREKKKMN